VAAVMQRLYPDRRIVTVPCREIVLGGGKVVQCIAPQQPWEAYDES
jgi:agmatine/peptidylarginine deiminase